MCPLDPCVFSLVTPDRQGKPCVRGILGIHVGDDIGGGDSYFSSVIEKLRAKYSFGTYNTGGVEFCGIHYRRQWDDGSIEMRQQEYLNRSRRQEQSSLVSDSERQSLRQICGSLQFGAVQTRPDICAKVGILQSGIAKATISDLLEASRLLYEAKITLCFNNDRTDSSREGGFLMPFQMLLLKPKRVILRDRGPSFSQLMKGWPGISCQWYVRSFGPVVRSHEWLAARWVQRLSWLRVLWSWICDPSDWSNPMEILGKAPLATVATDCKSVYDVSTKTSTPTCEEFRTTLECLLIRERLSENCKLRSGG